MKKTVLFLLALLAVSVLCPPAYASGPRLELSTEFWDMGTIFQWSNPSTEITLKNTGDEDLKILDTKSSCGCTPVVLSDKVIPPGGSGRLRIDFVSYDAVGKVRKEVHVFTNDPVSREKVIRIKGVVRESRKWIGYLTNDYVDIGVVAPYETRYFILDLGNKGNTEMPVIGVKLPDGCFLDSGEPTAVQGRSDVRMRIGYRPSKKGGPINEAVKVMLSGPEQKELDLKLVGYVSDAAPSADAVIITPTAFRLSKDSPGHGLEVAIKNGGKGSVLIDGAESSLPGAAPAVSSLELAPGESGSIGLKIKPEALEPGIKGYVYIRLAVPLEVGGGGPEKR